MPQPRLHYRRLGVRAAALDELHDVEARRAAQRLADVAGLHLRERVGEELGQPLVVAPAERAALQRIRGVGVRRGDARERRAAAHLGHRLLGSAARLADALGARALGHAHEDMGEVVLRALVGAVLQLLGRE